MAFRIVLRHVARRSGKDLFRATNQQRQHPVAFRFFSTRANLASDSPSDQPSSQRSTGKLKPWFERGRHVVSRAQEFLEAPHIHPADINDRDMEELLRQCCKLNHVEGLRMAQSILERLIQEKRKFQQEAQYANRPFSIRERMFTTVIYGWVVAASKLPMAPIRMRELLDMALREARHDEEEKKKILSRAELSSDTSKQKEQGERDDLISVQIYNSYLRGLSRAAALTSRAAITAEAVLYEMTELHQERGWHTKPNTRSYSFCIDAYANAKHARSPERALSLLNRMRQVHEAERKNYEERTGLEYDVLTPENNKWQIVTPDTITYTSVMKSMTHNYGGLDSVVELFNELLGSGQRLDNGIFVQAINAIAKDMDNQRNAKVRFEAAQRAEELLDMMLRQHVHENDSESSDASCAEQPVSEDDETAISRDPEVIQAFNACVDAWARSYCREGAPKAEALLQRMISGDKISPDTVTFNNCLYAWSRSHTFHQDAARRAEKLLELQLEISQATEAVACMKPDLQSFTICITTLAHSNEPDRLKKALGLLDLMLQKVKSGDVPMHGNPTAPFSAVLSVAARAPSDETSSDPSNAGTENADLFGSDDSFLDPYDVATRIYEGLENDSYSIGTRLNHHAMSAYLRCVDKHCPVGSIIREDTTKRVFDHACQLGEVSRLVVKAIQDTLGDDARDLLGNQPLRNRKWTRNVPHEFRRFSRKF